jgi:hypothetical protein
LSNKHTKLDLSHFKYFSDFPDVPCDHGGGSTTTISGRAKGELKASPVQFKGRAYCKKCLDSHIAGLDDAAVTLGHRANCNCVKPRSQCVQRPTVLSHSHSHLTAIYPSLTSYGHLTLTFHFWS